MFIEEQTNKKVLEEKIRLETKIRKEIEKEHKSEVDVLNNALLEKTEQLNDYNKVKAELEQAKRDNKEIENKLKFEKEKEITDRLNKEREKIREEEAQKYELKDREKQKKLDDTMKLVNELKRKQEQGSMQLQGEIQELAIEDYLRKTFPLDNIEEVKKGVKGGDCIQIVNTREMSNCGIIYYESKRTKNFVNEWIDKFKADMRTINATVGIIVTETYPKDMKRMGIRDGVWICSFEEFKGFVNVLRAFIIKYKTAIVTQENKTDKMNRMYNFLISNEFYSEFKNVVDTVKSIENQLNSEKTAMMKQWKVREKAKDSIMMSLVNIYGSINGIAGGTIQTINSLEFPNCELEPNTKSNIDKNKLDNEKELIKILEK